VYTDFAMVDVLTYDCYRSFLKDYYDFKKAANQAFSFRYFAKKANLKSGNYLKLVMEGQRNLTHKTVPKFIRALKLQTWEGIYFENLVFFNQSKEVEQKQYFKKNMALAIQQKQAAKLSRDQFQILNQWYPLVIKEMIQLSDFKLSPRWISERLDQHITISQAKEALALLERLDLIHIDKASKTVNIPNQMTQSENTVPASKELVLKYHHDILDRAQKALKEQDVNQRCSSSLIVAINKKDLKKAFEKIRAFRNEMDAFFVKKETYDAVYQLTLQLFRMDTDV